MQPRGRAEGVKYRLFLDYADIWSYDDTSDFNQKTWLLVDEYLLTRLLARTRNALKSGLAEQKKSSPVRLSADWKTLFCIFMEQATEEDEKCRTLRTVEFRWLDYWQSCSYSVGRGNSLHFSHI